MRTTFAVCLSLLLVACASQPGEEQFSGASQLKLSKPTIELVQISSVGTAARHITGGLPVQYRVTVTNNADRTIKLTRVALQSLGTGAYEVRPTSNPFDLTIEPQQTHSVEMWVPANIPYSSVSGANGPVTLRATVFFDSSAGKFQEILVENVASPSGI